MSENIVNCQGLACPQPLLRVKQYLESAPGEDFIVLVDNEAAQENVCRFLRSRNFTLDIMNEQGPLWRIHAHSTAAPQGRAKAGTATQRPAPTPQSRRLAVLITTPSIGAGDDGLGTKLMHNFLATLPEMLPELWRIILLNGGVTLCSAGNPALPALQHLEQAGVQIMVCGTCLEHFGLLPQKAVGETTNMLDVVTSLQLADSVIRP